MLYCLFKEFYNHSNAHHWYLFHYISLVVVWEWVFICLVKRLLHFIIAIPVHLIFYNYFSLILISVFRMDWPCNLDYSRPLAHQLLTLQSWLLTAIGTSVIDLAILITHGHWHISLQFLWGIIYCFVYEDIVTLYVCEVVAVVFLWCDFHFNAHSWIVQCFFSFSVHVHSAVFSLICLCSVVRTFLS